MDKRDLKRDLSEWRTTRDIANKHNVLVRDVQYHIKVGNIKASKIGLVGYFYVVHIDDVPKVWPPSSIPPPE